MLEAILIGLVAFVGFLEFGVGNSMIQRPIVMGPLVGLVLGDINTGLVVGATLELAFMGNVTIGAAVPPEVTAGGILGTAFAISTGGGVETAVALALPIATVALLVKNFYYLVIRAYFLHKSDTYAEAGNVKGVNRMHLVSFFSYNILMSVLMAVCYKLGGPTVETVLNVIPQFVKTGLSVASGILPALGFALLANMLMNKKVAPFFFLGFLISAYLKVPILGIALFGIILIALMLVADDNKQIIVGAGGAEDDF